MAAITTFADESVLPSADNITTGSANVLQELTFGAHCVFVSFYPRTNAGKLKWTAGSMAAQADGDTLSGDYITLPADGWTRIRLSAPVALGTSAVGSLFVTSATGSTVIEVVVEGPDAD